MDVTFSMRPSFGGELIAHCGRRRGNRGEAQETEHRRRFRTQFKCQQKGPTTLTSGACQDSWPDTFVRRSRECESVPVVRLAEDFPKSRPHQARGRFANSANHSIRSAAMSSACVEGSPAHSRSICRSCRARSERPIRRSSTVPRGLRRPQSPLTTRAGFITDSRS